MEEVAEQRDYHASIGCCLSLALEGRNRRLLAVVREYHNRRLVGEVVADILHSQAEEEGCHSRRTAAAVEV